MALSSLVFVINLHVQAGEPFPARSVQMWLDFEGIAAPADLTHSMLGAMVTKNWLVTWVGDDGDRYFAMV